MKKNNLKGLLLFLAVLGPGIITATVDNDAGGIATYSLAGAHFGYALLWTLIPITVSLIIIQEMAARMGAVTGKGLAELIRENFGVKITFFIMLSLIIANIGTTIAEFAGIATAGEIFGFNKHIFIPLIAILIWFIVYKGNYGTVEKIFLLVSSFYVAYIISGFLAKPAWNEVLSNTIVPSFSFNKDYVLIVIALIGTTITPWMQFYLQSSIVEKGIDTSKYKYSRMDVVLGSIITDVIALFIIVASAATIFAKSVPVNNAKDIALSLAPIAGEYATYLFSFGLFAAGFLAAAILPLATAYPICGAFGWESGLNKKFREAPQFYTLFTFIIGISSLFVIFPTLPLLKVFIFSQALNGIILPIILIFMLLLVNNKKIMGDYTNSLWLNVVTWLTIITIVVLTIILVITSFFY